MAVEEPADPSVERLDCLIVGGGPAGLTAAIYLARFHLTVRVIDAGHSRAALIPLTRNHVGFPDGISGGDLLARMPGQARVYGARLQDGHVAGLAHDGRQFIAEVGPGFLHAQTVLLATGVVNRRPAMMDAVCHDRALATGQLRYCPICDGYEVTDKAIAILGTGERGYNEAMFLRGYSANITLVASEGGHILVPAQCAALTDAGILIAGQCTSITLMGEQIALDIEGATRRFDTLYPALGSDIRSELAGMVGASRTPDGCLTVDLHQRTDVPCLYAAGDLDLGQD